MGNEPSRYYNTPKKESSTPGNSYSSHWSGGSLDRVVDNAVDISIEQLYINVCEMDSSDHSPSRHSLVSCENESRIDSELQRLVGVESEGVEEMRESILVTGNKKEGNLVGHSILQEKRGSPNPKSTLSRRKSFRGRRSFRKPNVVCTLKKAGLDNPDLGPLQLREVRDLIASGDNPKKALKLALRAVKLLEKQAIGGKTNLELVICLHVLAAVHCSLGQYGEAILVLKRSIEALALEVGQSHALAKFAGLMQLGDAYSMLGQIENSIPCYTAGLGIQRQVLGEMDSQFHETCRYVAEAHIQALQFDEAEKLCQKVLNIHKENGLPASLEEAEDRSLMGHICASKGDHEAALKNYVLASVAMASKGKDTDVAAISCSIGDSYQALARYDEALSAYQKALTIYKLTKGDYHLVVSSIYIRMADLYNEIGKFWEAKSYCESALRIYGKANINGISSEEIASSLVDISAIYQSMNELDLAVMLLQKAQKIYGDATCKQTTIARIEAQIGVMYYMMENYSESYESFKSAISKIRVTEVKKSAFFGITLNQMGLACMQSHSINEAADRFNEARGILEEKYGPSHPETLAVCSNLAVTYGAMGRFADAVEILQYVVGIREGELGTENPDVNCEKSRLVELLLELGRIPNRKLRYLETHSTLKPIPE